MSLHRRGLRAAALAAGLALPALAVANGTNAASATRSPVDPFEPWNRGVFALNEAIDDALLKPVATLYRDAVPEPVRDSVGNFFGNVDDAWSAINQFLQGKPQAGLRMTMRVAMNTTFGLAGLLDVAREAGLERESEDFGQTLGRWGFGAGPYLVWPLLGPSSLRDSAAMPLDRAWSPVAALKEDADRAGLLGLQLVDTRSRLLGASRLIDDVALDKYRFVRDAWLARRRNLVHDGEPPPEAADPEADQPVSAPPR